ncbi:hypothetical protein TIFTF001_018371, partial [Ficus carica]
MGAKNP